MTNDSYGRINTAYKVSHFGYLILRLRLSECCEYVRQYVQKLFVFLIRSSGLGIMLPLPHSSYLHLHMFFSSFFTKQSWAAEVESNLNWSPFILLTLGCGWTSGVGSGAFGVGSVSAASVLGGVGGGAGSLGQTGSQGQRRQGCRHTLVVVHPRKSLDIILKQPVFNNVYAANFFWNHDDRGPAYNQEISIRMALKTI